MESYDEYFGRISWDKYFMVVAKVVALRSGCNSRPTGAVIVKNKRIIATGYNGANPNYPQCNEVSEKFCLRREIGKNDKGEKKYSECPAIHAEQNALNQAAIMGVSVSGSTVYCTLFPCIFCFKNLESCGVKKIFFEYDYKSDDSERDLYWRKKVEDSPIEIERLTLDKRDIFRAKEILSSFTSTRRFLK